MSLYICPNSLNVQNQVIYNVSYGLWVIMMCEYRFIDYNKFSNLVGDISSRGAEGTWELCTFYSILL